MSDVAQAAPEQADRVPPARRADVVDVLHGVAVPDPYRWLEDPDDPETLAWSQAQQRLFERHRAGWRHRPAFAAHVEALLGAGSVGVPVWRGERCFQSRREPGQEHPVLLVRNAAGETGRVLIDPMALDPSGATTLDAWQPSKEGTMVAVQLSTGGTEESVLQVLDAATGAVVDGPVDRVRYSPVAWFPGGQAYCYVRRLPPDQVPPDEAQFHRRVLLHRVGTSHDLDIELFGAGRDPRSYYGVSISRDGRWLLLSAAVGTQPRNDLWIAPVSLTGPSVGALQPVMTDTDARAAGWVHRDGRLYVLTDLDAPRGRLCVTDPGQPSVAHWHTLIAERSDAVLEDVALLDGPELPDPRLLASWTAHAVSEVTEHRAADGHLIGPVDLPGVGTVGGLVEHPDGGPTAWWSWTDISTPGRVLAYDARTRRLAVWAEPPGVVQPPPVRTEQVVVTSTDGTPVRMFVISAALPAEVLPRPTILTGYGGFGISMTPGYSAGILAWVAAGGVYAIACLRGGGEEGEAWHRAGMLASKQAVFDDATACARWLVEHGWTTSSQLGISGGSNGGLLVGALITQHPELMAAAVCSAPLLDMVRYEHFGLGATWNVEYGSAANPEQFGWLWSYSPYHRVRPGIGYPAVLFTVFDGDTRVDPMHARKMCAALQQATAGDRPVLLRAESDVGHGGRAVSRSVALAADTLAFQAAMLGLPDGPAESGEHR